MIPIPKHIEGMKAYYDTGFIKISTGSCTDDGSEDNAALVFVDEIVVNPGVVGVNGIDAGSLGDDLYYYVWAIYNSTTESSAGLISLSSTSPQLPTGYDKKRLLSAFRTISSATILDFITRGNGHIKFIEYLVELNQFNVVLANGDDDDWTVVDVSSRVPPISFNGKFCVCNYEGSEDHVHVRPFECEDDGMTFSIYSICHESVPMECPEQKIEYKTGLDGNAFIAVSGFELNLIDI